jgi:hypothetical protein
MYVTYIHIRLEAFAVTKGIKVIWGKTLTRNRTPGVQFVVTLLTDLSTSSRRHVVVMAV